MLFTKMQGAGNDFVLLKPENMDLNWPRLAQKMCHRRFGIGADGIILILPSRVADIRMRIFNSDGSEAEICGNGLRCLAKYAVLNNLVKKGATQLLIETIPRVVPVQLGYTGTELTWIQVGIGIPSFAAGEIPVQADAEKIPILDFPLMVDGHDLYLNFISMGNPHAVYFIDEKVTDFPLHEIGPKVEHAAIFPRRINFEVARILNRGSIEARVWERGAGETLACGTGACAVAVAARVHNYTGDKVDIMLPGGTLNIEWDGRGEVRMSGPAEVVYRGDWP